MGTTQTIHEMEMMPKKGIHKITVVDELGNEAKRTIEIRE